MHESENGRITGITWRRILVLFAGIGIVVSLAGCSSSEQFGAITATTDLPPGTVVTLETQTTQIGFFPTSGASVDATGRVRFNRLLPGEYRLVTLDRSGAVTHATPSFGVGVAETRVSFLTAASSSAPSG